MNKIDILIINNVPSFYKINLYNELAKKCKVHVIFIGITSQVVINEDFKKDIMFSFDLISNIQIENRNKLNSLKQIYSIIKRFDYSRVIYGGYNYFETIILMFLTPKNKNCLQFESSIKESKVSGLISLIKKIILNRISIALPSGRLQTDVFKALGFKGKIIETLGVGIFYKGEVLKKISLQKKQEFNYIYVGRLIELKNISWLIEVFNNLNKPLTIVGNGILEEQLKLKAKSNIKFTGFIDNNKIGFQYSNHDVFVLPSFIEPWGLVVEEAIYYGLPVLVSDAVGCQEEMVKKVNTGIVFNPKSTVSLKEAIFEIEENYNKYKSNSVNFDFLERDKNQVDAYLKILE